MRWLNAVCFVASKNATLIDSFEAESCAYILLLSHPKSDPRVDGKVTSADAQLLVSKP